MPTRKVVSLSSNSVVYGRISVLSMAKALKLSVAVHCEKMPVCSPMSVARKMLAWSKLKLLLEA